MSPASMPNIPTNNHLNHKEASSPLSRTRTLPKSCPEAPELTRPTPVLDKRMTSEDVPSVDPHSLVMSLKSGLLAETAWGLNILNILLRDDRTMSFCLLASLPGLLDSLVEHWSDAKESRWRGEECEEPELIDVTRGDIVGEYKEKVVLLNRAAARSVSFVEDRKGAAWVECAGSSDGFIVRYGGLNNRMGVEEEEALNLVEEVEEMMRSKLSAVTLALRNLSFVPGNEECMGNDTGFLAMCGEVLAKNEMMSSLEEVENVMTCLANIALHTDLSTQPSSVVWDILTSVLDWTVSECPNMTLQKMALEILCKLCLHQYNTDLILATPVDTLNKLCQTLASSFYKPYEQEMREMSISIIYYMVSASTIWSLTISQTTHTIPLLISFIEKAEETAQSVVSYQGVASLRDNPSLLGTSLGTLRRAAAILSILAQETSSSNIFMMEERRLVDLAMSQVLDREVANSICEAMYVTSKEYESGRIRWSNDIK